MLRLIYFFIIFAFGNALQHLGAGVKGVVSHPKFHETIHNHTHHSALKECPDFENRLQNATKESQQCFHEHYDPQHHNLCNFILKEFKKCAEPITSLVKSCLPKNSKDTPGFLVDSLLDLFNFICISKGSALLELTQPCITHSFSDEHSLCANELNSQLGEYRKNFPNRKEICRFESTFKSCLHSQLEENCTSRVTIDNFFKFYEAIQEPCKKVK